MLQLLLDLLSISSLGSVAEDAVFADAATASPLSTPPPTLPPNIVANTVGDNDSIPSLLNTSSLSMSKDCSSKQYLLLMLIGSMLSLLELFG